jgi:hypothetical protein
VTHAQQMLQTNPSSAAVDASTLMECMEACFDCAQSCTACADACLGEDDPKSLSRCIRLNLDCADVCDATGHIVSRQTAFEPETARAALQACAEECSVCGQECERHASHHEHCRVPRYLPHYAWSSGSLRSPSRLWSRSKVKEGS